MAGMQTRATEGASGGVPGTLTAADRERTERLATLGTLAGSIAHEVNNLLTPVLSYAQMALAAPEDVELGQKALQKAVEGAERAAAAASSILGFIRGDEVALVHVGHALRDALGCLAREPSKDGIELVVDVPVDAWVAISPVRLQQVLLNLLLNARKAIIPRPGRIEVVAVGGSSPAEGCSTWNTPPSVVDRPPGVFHVEHRPTPASEACTAQLVRIEVRDTGCGMAPELAAAAFEPFVRGSSREGGMGTGLGLPICKRIIEAAGGSIMLTSTPGQGTVVTITLPRADPMETGMDGFGGGSAGSISPTTPHTNAARSRAA